MAIEIVSFPINSMVILHSCLLVLPEGIFHQPKTPSANDGHFHPSDPLAQLIGVAVTDIARLLKRTSKGEAPLKFTNKGGSTTKPSKTYRLLDYY